MRHGFKIFDSDTHLNPLAETLEPYFDAAMRKRLPEWESCKVPFASAGPARFCNHLTATVTSSRKEPGWRGAPARSGSGS